MRCKVSTLQDSHGKILSESKTLKNALEVALRQLTASKQAKQETEAALRLEIKHLRVEHEKAMVTMSSKVETVIASSKHQLEEAQAIMDSRQALSCKWKEEALVVS